MNKAVGVLLGAALCLPATARDESIGEMAARYRLFCNQQPREVRAECHRNARDRIALEQARREADRAERKRQRGK